MREAAYLRTRYRCMLGQLGLFVSITGLVLLSPLVLAIGEGAAAALAFAVPGATLAVAGAAARRRWRVPGASLSVQEAGLVVLLAWALASVAGAAPLVWLSGLSWSQAIFEAVSGWTTTGLSVLDVTKAAPSVLLWRSTMQLVGGAGLAILAVAATTSPAGAALSLAEGRGDHLTPNVRASARLVLQIYIGYTLAGIVALRVAGMHWFDAVNHAFCAVSTGGFSTRTDSIGAFDSVGIEAITIVLMVLGNLNFLTAWCLLRGRFRAFFHNGEIRLLTLLLAASAVLAFAFTTAQLYGSVGKAWRVAVFETASALTTTGYSTVGYRDWNGFGILLMIALMLIGAGACSTGGALKQLRVHTLYRVVVRELRRPFLPRAAIVDEPFWVGEERGQVTDAQVRGIAVFLFLYLVTWLAGSAVLTIAGADLGDALFEYASTLGTVGLSIGVTGPTTPAPVLWTQIAGMVLGRLEFFVVFAGIGKLAADGRRLWRSAR